MAEFILYGYPFRSRAERIIWTLDEYGFEYELRRIDPRRGENRTEEFLKLNPAGKIPVLIHHGRAYSESVAIMEYLNSVSTNLKLIPEDRQKYYQFRYAMHYGTSELEAYLWIGDQSSRLNSIYKWPDGTNDNALKLLQRNITIVFKWLSANPYICGNEFTLADIYYCHLLMWAKSNGARLESVAENYVTMLHQRPAFPELMRNQ